MTQKICVLGSGGMGTALALVLAEKSENEVWLWSHTEARNQDLNQYRENRRYLPGIALARQIHLTAEAEAALVDCDLLVAAVPTQHLRCVLKSILTWLPEHTPILSVAKGLENSTLKRPSELIAEVAGKRAIGALGGPSHAEEFARRFPCSVVVASEDGRLRQISQEWFSTDRFRVYTNSDIAGVELAGALKNVVAIAAGICDGLNYGDNAKAALLGRGIHEMIRFGLCMGAKADTFVGLAGVGDLITTCCSRFGRNRKVGELIAQGMTLEDALNQIHGIPEGVTTCRSVVEVGLKHQLELPIFTEVYRLLFEGKSPEAATNSLMNRPPRAEL